MQPSPGYTLLRHKTPHETLAVSGSYVVTALLGVYSPMKEVEKQMCHYSLHSSAWFLVYLEGNLMDGVHTMGTLFAHNIPHGPLYFPLGFYKNLHL